MRRAGANTSTSARRRPRGRVAIALGLIFAASTSLALVFGGCAKGTSPNTGGGGTGASSGGSVGGTGGSTTGIGAPCETEQDCPTGGACISIGGQKVCTQACPPACPDGSYCTLVQGDPYCVPDVGSQCSQCLGTAQCKGLTDECLTAPAGDKFCARDCTVMEDCPTGFVCVEKTDYEALALGGSGGSGGAGGAGGGGGLGLPDAGSKPPAGQPHKFCVKDQGLSCPCNDKRDGVTKSCDVKNEFGTCPGLETCDGKGGVFVGCSAKTPATETCNASDDDCNGTTDEGDPNVLCGGAPPHGQWACGAGSCSLASCDPGWTQYPPGDPSVGCPCLMDMSEPNDDCLSAADAGTVSDTGGTVEIQGTMSKDGDVDVWVVHTVDTDEPFTNSYHVSIDLVQDVGAEIFLLDVMRGDGSCVDAPSGAATGITSYDWCVDGKSADGMMGEAPCDPMGAIHCNDHSAPYYLRVYRKPGAPAACVAYKITVSAKGGDACDFTNQCN